MDILIVEDDPMVGQINQKFARRLPFVRECDIADNPETAKEDLLSKHYDLILLDVYFPTGRGPDLLQWIRNEQIGVHVIFITADNSQETVERAAHLGALDYLVKPFTFERFSAALEEAEVKISSIKGSSSFNQETLDRVFKKEKIPEESQSFELDKGMSMITYKMVQSELSRMTGEFTAEDMGDKLGMARVTIRRYLDFMEKQGLLTVNLQYGKVGRPQHHYKVKQR
ncbi:MAG: response regulator [Spirochaetales bacterium]|nr:response regulator [Spirochaetales bacterium]